jgi:hypothetical protein
VYLSDSAKPSARSRSTLIPDSGYMSEPGEVCVRTAAGGLPIRYVIGIEVLGDQDRELLAQAGLLETE